MWAQEGWSACEPPPLRTCTIAAMVRASSLRTRSTPSRGRMMLSMAPVMSTAPKIARCWMPYPSPVRALMKTRKVWARVHVAGRGAWETDRDATPQLPAHLHHVCVFDDVHGLVDAVRLHAAEEHVRLGERGREGRGKGRRV